MTVPAAGSGELTDVAPEGAVELSALAERLRLSMIRLGRQLRFDPAVIAEALRDRAS